MRQLMNISLALLVLSFAACKKADVGAPVPVLPKVKTFTIMDGAAIINSATIEYDNLGRRSKQTFKDDSRFDFTYTGNTMLQEQFNSSGATQSKYNYILNAEGLAESYYNLATPKVIYYQTFNSAKQMVLEITKNIGVKTFEVHHFYDNTGNNIKDSVLHVNGTTIRTYEYYTDKISTITNSNYGTKYDGVSSKNSLKKVTVKSPLNVITITDYSVPELDAKGKVIKQSYTSGGKIFDYLYSYY